MQSFHLLAQADAVELLTSRHSGRNQKKSKEINMFPKLFQRQKNAAPGNADQHTIEGGRNPHREEQVKGLSDVALAHGKAAIRENSGRPLVRDLVTELLRLELTAAAHW